MKNYENFIFVKGNIADAKLVNEVFKKYTPNIVVNLAVGVTVNLISDAIKSRINKSKNLNNINVIISEEKVIEIKQNQGFAVTLSGGAKKMRRNRRIFSFCPFSLFDNSPQKMIILKSLPSVPKNVTLFRNMVIADAAS